MANVDHVIESNAHAGSENYERKDTIFGKEAE